MPLYKTVSTPKAVRHQFVSVRYSTFGTNVRASNGYGRFGS